MHQILELNPLERIISDNIKDVVSQIRAAAKHKREEGQNDKSLDYAENFLREYQQCKWQGIATDLLKENVSAYLVYSHRINSIKKLTMFIAIAGAGMITALIGHKINSPAVAIAGDLIGIASVIGTYISFRIAGEKTEKIYHALKSDADTINKILRHQYEEEKCQNS